MIKNVKFGNHENVVLAEFGTGDIRICRAKSEEMRHENMLMFFNREKPAKIGQEDDDYTGEHSDNLPTPGFVMQFNDPRSITALIHSLVELQKSVFEIVAEKKEGEKDDLT